MKLADFVLENAEQFEEPDGQWRMNLPSRIRFLTGGGSAGRDALTGEGVTRTIRARLRRQILEDTAKRLSRGEEEVPVYGLDELQIDCVASGGQPHFEVVNGFTGGSRVGPLVEVRTVVEGLPHARREVVAAPLTIGRGLPGVDADVTVPDLDQFRSVSRLALLLEPDLVVGVLRCQVRSISGAIYRPRVGEPRTQRVNDVVDLMPGDAIQLTHDDSFTVLYLLDPDETSEVPVM